MEGIKTFTIKKIERILGSKADIGSLVECINSMEIKATPIGEGGNAVVYAVLGGSFDKVCLKKVKDKPQIIFNDIDQEHYFQINAREAGVRTPFSLISINTNNGRYLIMERIRGNSVLEIIKNPKLLPEKFGFQEIL